ncbi:uncharacterized protein LOC125063658 [Pieris napi]|uniref:uncharacterized protein LOC125063658 n=1 Tax=Pieris napi TaxID=78633 RepID=UPI001FBB7828|nr:uncharacterized protein LOC125063658 [Pieris napi]
MSKPCKKIKNPCKICLGPVTRKNGLQCQGFCQCWVHYACLNYTPGKIKDIKAGIILVNCPCPDCNSSLPKEYRSDEPYSCTNLQCPANITPKCDNTGCPINKQQGQKGGNMRNTGAGSSCPLGQCGKECKENSKGSNQPGREKTGISCGQSCKETSVPLRAGAVLPHQIPPRPESPPSCPSGCSLPPGDLGQSSDPLPALEQMCNTVGQLTNQINDLMQQMKNVVQGGGGSGGGSGGGPGRDPKSCYCPGNPGHKR